MTEEVIGNDDAADDFTYRWHGPNGAESWWPAMAMSHVAVYAVTVGPALVLGLLYALVFGRSLPGIVVPPVVAVLTATLIAGEIAKRTDRNRPLRYHWLTFRTELAAPRPERGGPPVTTTSPITLLESPK